MIVAMSNHGESLSDEHRCDEVVALCDALGRGLVDHVVGHADERGAADRVERDKVQNNGNAH